jgi:hypothetical protein
MRGHLRPAKVVRAPSLTPATKAVPSAAEANSVARGAFAAASEAEQCRAAVVLGAAGLAAVLVEDQ